MENFAIKAGDFALVQEDRLEDWYIGQVIKCIGGSREPKDCTLIQVANIDTGLVKIISSDYVKGIINSKKN